MLYKSDWYYTMILVLVSLQLIKEVQHLKEETSLLLSCIKFSTGVLVSELFYTYKYLLLYWNKIYKYIDAWSQAKLPVYLRVLV